MGGDLVPVKTPEGQRELSTRRLRLSQRHRTVLFLIDGRRTEAQVRHLAGQAGVPDTCFDELLGLSLIALPDAAAAAPAAGTPAPIAPPAPAAPPVPWSPIPLVVVQDSLLPASGTLAPDSSALDSISSGPPPPDSWLPSETAGKTPVTVDLALEQARETLLRLVRADAPLTGSLTVLRLKRARTRDDLSALLDEVEGRVNKRHRSLSAAQSLVSVRQLLARPGDAAQSAA